MDRDTGGSVPGLLVEAWDTGQLFNQALGTATSNADGAFEIPLNRDIESHLIQGKAQVFFRVLRAGAVVADTHDTVRWDPNQPHPVTVPVPPASIVPSDPFDVHGTVLTDRGTMAGGLVVGVWDWQVTGPVQVASGATGGDGRYRVVYDPAKLGGKQLGDIEVRVFDPAGATTTTATTATSPAPKELVRSKVVYQAPRSLSVDLVVPFGSVPQPSEHDRLTGALQPLIGNTAPAQVGPDGVMYLANRGGFDPRAVAMSVQAQRASAQTGIPAEHYYALFRMGAATDLTTAHRLTDANFVAAIDSATKGGIIAGTSPIDASLRIHQAQAVAAFRTFVPKAGMSSLDDLLGIRLDEAGKVLFINTLRATKDSPKALWDGLAAAGMNAQVIAQLQTDGKLGHLTLQNAPLMRRLVESHGVASTGDLVKAQLYEPAAWLPLIGQDVPAGLSADTYAAGLAAQVRLSHPTLVTADLVQRGKVTVGTADATTAVAGFLAASDGAHRIGEAPMRTWAGFNALAAPAQQSALRLERLYQITPSDDAMQVLATAGLDSAYRVARYGEAEFLARFGTQFPSVRQAQLVHRKAQQVHGTVLNTTLHYLLQKSSPQLYALGGALGPFVLPENTPGKATLETLLGNLDYCTCEACESVLSPAAYFVDLLEMLDLHDIAHVGDDPQTVLFGRRPDLQHILLTCENTNVAMPYIDLVNEVLEYYVVHGSLTNFAGHDTAPTATTADLLVDPQFVEAAAYTPLTDAPFPVPLPFHMPLEALRLQFQAWGTQLAEGLAVFGTPASVLRETLGLNPAEWSILTDSTFKKLPEHFGEPAAATLQQLNDAISNAKVFCRRLGLAYMDLDAILRTRFVNPGIGLIDLFQALKVGFDVIQTWFDHTLTDAQFTALLPPGLDPAPYGGNVLTWLTANRQLLMGLVVLDPTTAATSTTDCDFGTLQLRLSKPDPATNTLTDSEYTKLYRFVRIWRRLGWDITSTDELLATFLPPLAPNPVVADLDAAFVTALPRIANLLDLLSEMSVPAKARGDWLSLFDADVAAADRRAALGRLLRLGTVDFDTLTALTGVDPLAMDMEAPEPSLLRFLAAWKAFKGSRLKISDLNWLVRHQDPAATKTPPAKDLARESRALRDALSGVDQFLSAGSGGDLATMQSLMALVYDPAVVSRFFGLLGGSITYAAVLTTAEEGLPAKLAAAAAGLGFDPFGKWLTYAGILSTARRDAIKAAADTLVLADMGEIGTAAELTAYVAAVKTAADALRASGVADRDGFVADYPELGAVLDAAVAATSQAQREAIVHDGVLPGLRTRLKAAALRTTLATLLRVDEAVVAALIAGPAVLHANATPGAGVLDDFTAVEAPIALDHNQVADLWLDPQVTDDHILYVRAPAGTVVALTVDGSVAIASAPVGASGEVATAAPLPLAVGTPVHLGLTISALPAASSAVLAWRTKGMAKTPIPADRVTSVAAAGQVTASLLRLHKVVLLAGSVGLTPAELTFFAATCPDTSAFLNDLPVDATIAAPAVVALAAKIMRLIDFAPFRNTTETDPDTWVDILRTSALGTPDGQARAAATGSWQAADVTAAIAFLGVPAPGLMALDTLAKLRRILDLAVLTNQSVANLRAWTIADPTAADVQAMKDAVRAALDPAAWAASMQSVNDALRNQRRDALVAYILTHAQPTPDIVTADDLYTYFLIDVEMDACMQTSRIRLALSTVQLFVTRCLMNLEPQVSPASIRADRWQWMNRYRVWEANRKIFLYPENWLEPELRDGKSSFFQELESELLKSDITNDLAETAFLGYLKKLDDVARLEIVGMHLQEGVTGKDEEDILHVFGRTNGKNREYYYRRFEHGYWTAWERVGLNIEGDSVLPAIWKNQLYLFWVTTLEKPRGGSQDSSGDTMANQKWQARSPIDVEVTLSWGEYFGGKWTSPKSTNMRRPLVLRGLQEFKPQDLVLAVRTEDPPNVSERLVMSVVYYDQGHVKAYKVVFTSKNCSPIVVEDDADALLRMSVETFYHGLFWDRQPESTLDSTSLDVPRFDLTLRVGQPANAWSPIVDEDLLTKKLDRPGFNVRPTMHPVENQWEAPFFYADEHSTFLVHPSEQVYDFTLIDIYVAIPIDVVVLEVPPLVQQVAVPNPVDPIWNPGWMQLVNPNIKNVIGANVSFALDGVQFGALGLVR